MTSLVITVRSMVRKDAFDSDERPVKEPEVPPVMRAIAAMAWLSVKSALSGVRPSWPPSPRSAGYRSARAGRAGRPAPGGEERGFAVTRNLLRLRDTKFRIKHLDSELRVR
jgi:hypothetical protein